MSPFVGCQAGRADSQSAAAPLLSLLLPRLRPNPNRPSARPESNPMRTQSTAPVLRQHVCLPSPRRHAHHGPVLFTDRTASEVSPFVGYQAGRADSQSAAEPPLSLLLPRLRPNPNPSAGPHRIKPDADPTGQPWPCGPPRRRKPSYLAQSRNVSDGLPARLQRSSRHPAACVPSESVSTCSPQSGTLHRSDGKRSVSIRLIPSR